MKKYTPLFVIILISLVVSIFVFLDVPRIINKSGFSWEFKKKEIRSRLLSIPILVYHNIDGKGVFSIDHDVLRSHFRMFKEKNIRIIKLEDLVNRLSDPKPYNEKAAVLTFDDGYYSMYSKLLPLAKEFGYPITLFVYVNFINSGGKNSLTWELLKKMDREGIDIQGHSLSHSDLTKFSGKDDYLSGKKMYEEIYLSKLILSIYLDKEIKYFAFPYGRYDLRIIDYSINSGYERVFSTDYGSNVVTRNNICLRRHHIKKSYSLEYIENLLR